MKKKIRIGALTLSLSMLLCLLVVHAAAPQPSQVTVELRPSVTILVDGTERTFYDVTGKEVHTLYYDGTHYLPVRAIGELMGKNVNWDGNSKTISLASPRTSASTSGTPDTRSKDATIIVEWRPDISIVVDGTTRSFKDAQGNPVYVLLNSGTNYLPVRAIGELMGKAVSWNGQTRTITLSDPRSNEPLVTDADTFGPTGGTEGPSSSVLIGEAAAKSAALTHAKLKDAQVTFVECKLDWEDNRRVYDVEFYTAAGQEYDYEIDAYTGAVLSVDYDAENYIPSTKTGFITREQAQSIALGQVSGASASHIYKVELDRDDGQYEVEILYNGWEYEFEIDARTGAILKSESEQSSSVRR